MQHLLKSLGFGLLTALTFFVFLHLAVATIYHGGELLKITISAVTTDLKTY